MHSSTIYAVASPPASLNQAHAFRHVLETDDLLVVGRYQLTADGVTGDGDWDDFTRSDAFFELLDASSVLVQRANAPTIGPGLFGIYFNATAFAATSIVWGDNSGVRIITSPTLFTPNVTGAVLILEWQASSSAAETSIALGNSLLEMIFNIEQENPGSGAFDFDARELVSGGFITQTGAQFALDAFSLAVVVAPQAFSSSASIIGQQFGGSFLSLMTLGPATAQADVVVADVTLFTVDMFVFLRDSASQEVIQIQSIDSNTNILTMATNLVNNYSVANTGVVVAAGLQAEIEVATLGDRSRTAVEGFGTALGLSTGSGGLIAMVIMAIAFLFVGISVSGSTLVGVSPLPSILTFTTLAGWTEVGLLATFMVIVGLMASIWFWKSVPT